MRSRSAEPRLRDLDEVGFAERYGCDRLTASLLANRFRYVNEHMATKLRTNAFSVVIRDMDDFCTTVQGPPELDWAMPASSMTNPIHWGPVTDAVRVVLEEVGLEELGPGDVIACNDSYRTGKHLNDMSFMRPLFVGDRLVGALHVTAHQLDVGSKVPGGFDTLSGSLWEDGLVLTPVFLYRGGTPVRSTFSMIAANTRWPDIILADLQVIAATLDLGEALLQESIARYGLDAYLGAIRYACDVAGEELARALAALPDGVYEAVHVIGQDARNDGPSYSVHLQVRKAGHRLEFDFSGTSPQSPTSLNCSWLDAKTGVMVALKELFDRRSVPCSGSLRDIDFLLPAESFLNAQPPASTMSYYALVDAVIRVTIAALNPALGEQAIALDTAMPGSGGHRASGVTADGTPWQTSAVTNIPAFPKGATSAGDADSYGLVAWMNSTNLSTEVLELTNPVLLLEAEAVPDTGGPGRHRGGASLRTTTQYRHGGTHHVGRRTLERGAAGANGGSAGSRGRADHFTQRPLGEVPAAGEVGEPLPGAVFEGLPGATFRTTMASGGGWGDPFERDVALVLRDVRDGYLTIEGAARDHGVVVVGDPLLEPEDLAVDDVSTATMRSRSSSPTGGAP